MDNLDWIKKGIQNANAVVYKLRLVSTRANNHRLEIVRREKQKREEMVERQKTKVIAVKRRRDRGGISLLSEEEENYESDTKDDTKPTTNSHCNTETV